ncbi:glycosyltransferase [Nostoc sp. UHCC 0251]|uniref:glycosyltransferase n=1 Tax=Nostoc sp. UHCC 0251 TaxID=3110240 RepID=UPI002B21E42B|nr:glycosyltransferase [Nostoc sp. UHCC 0251]MEA5626232.1 glycosyltransferase [Nostoc sp. UHCC 0251]
MTLSNPLISVTMATYNHEKYIGEAIESVLNQTYKNFELIIVNDGSNDKTDEIIKNFRDERITYIYQENQGISSAMNRAILDSRGKYVAFMSGDDICDPYRLETQYNYLVTSQKKAVFSWVDFIDENSQMITNSHFAENFFNHPTRTRSEILRHFFFNGNYINAVTGFICRELILDAGLFNLASIQLQDFEMWLKLVKKHDLFILNNKLIKYRIRAADANLSSISNQARSNFELCQIHRNIFNDVTIETFKEAFCNHIRKPDFSTEIEYNLEKAFIYLLHDLHFIQCIGAEKLFELLQNQDILDIAKQKYDFGLTELYQLTKDLDATNFVLLHQLKDKISAKEGEIAHLKSLFRQSLLKAKVDESKEDKQPQEERLNLSDAVTYKITSIKKPQPLVTICIPSYNGEDFVAESIASALWQTYPNIEIILSDDNSIDRTVEIAKSLEQKSSFEFLILEHAQYGLSQNWNFCISQAKGKYIKFLFQDDLLEPTAIEEMVNVAEQDEEIGLVFSPRTLFTNTGHTVYDSNFLMHHEAKDVHKAWSTLKLIQSGQQLLLDPNILDNPINKIGEPSTVLIRKDVFEKVGLFNSEFCQLVDLEMWLRIMSQYKIGFVNKVLSHFRIHPQQQTRRNVALKDAILLDYQKLFKTIYSDTRYPQATRQQALYRYATLSEQNAELHQLRKEIAEECLNISNEQITDMYLGLLGKTHKMLVNSSIKYENLTDEEQIFVNDIVKTISQGFDQPKAIQYLLAAMLYRRADQLPLQHDLSPIPRWLLKDYLQFLFSCPVHFQEVGDADNYYYYMQGWIDYLHTSILKNPDSDLWDEIINNFAPIANFIPLYFNEANLKDIYVKRGEIIEYLLKLKGYEVDYEFADRPISRKKIRLGVLAAHFLPGSETFAYLPVYEYISRDFEVILYSLNQTDHPLELYCRSCANSFKLLPQDLVEQVNIIRADDLDILFIATNVTAVTNQICLLLMHRLARIQATSGGSVVTTGMRHIDYYISGTLTDPSPTAAQHYREKLVKLEGTAHCFSYGTEQEKITLKVERETLGITDDAVIFISGANYFKIIPELIETWAKIIIGVPNSVLVLLPFGPNWSNAYPKKTFVNHLSKVFSKYGIPIDRLIVLDPQPVPNREEVKEYFKIADIYLDSYPFAGTTSLVEPLQVNLPVIARQGTSFRSAMGAAMVQTLDVPGLVADSEESYIQLAVALGTDPELRQQKSAQIKEKMQGNPNFLDSRFYSAKIGSLFQELFSKYLADTLNQNFRLGNINLITFPDWSQPEDLLYQDLASVISTLTTHPDKSNITLLIDTQSISEEEADMLLSSLTMNLLMEDDVDITEGPEISLLGKLSNAQWKTLLPRINTRIALATDNQSAIAQVKAENLSSCNVDTLITSKLEMTPAF